MIEATKGPSGGYNITVDLDQISLKDFLRNLKVRLVLWIVILIPIAFK